MNSENFSFSQNTLFSKKKWEIQGGKIKLSATSLFKAKEMTFNLDEIDENSEQVLRPAYDWLVFLVIFSFGSVTHFLLTAFKPAWASHWSLGFFLLFAITCSLFGYFNNSIHRLTYYSLTKQASFNLCVNKPNQDDFNSFVLRLNIMIVLSHKRRELVSVIQNFPTDFLKEEFAVFYAEELLRRGINIRQLISSVRKECLLNYMPDSAVGRVLN